MKLFAAIEQGGGIHSKDMFVIPYLNEKMNTQMQINNEYRKTIKVKNKEEVSSNTTKR